MSGAAYNHGALFEWRVSGCDDAWRAIDAFDAYSAAKAVATEWDRDHDYAMLNCDECPVFEIRLVEDRRPEVSRRYAPIATQPTYWSARAESVPSYYPHEVARANAGGTEGRR